MKRTLLAQLAASTQALNVLCFGIAPKAYAVLVLRAPARLGPIRFYSYADFIWVLAFTFFYRCTENAILKCVKRMEIARQYLAYEFCVNSASI